MKNKLNKNKFDSYYTKLINQLEPLYQPQVMGTGGHDVNHIHRMLKMEAEISEFLDFDSLEYKTVVWLHNVDRSSLIVDKKNLKTVLQNLLRKSYFDDITKERIISAVLQHSKKDDELTDTTLLRALRLADKWDRIGAIGIVDMVAFRGSSILAYDLLEPFGYGLTAEGRMKTLYQSFFRVLEWYADFPLVRRLSKKHPERIKFLLNFIRAFGAEVALNHNIENQAEIDIRKALGIYYDELL